MGGDRKVESWVRLRERRSRTYGPKGTRPESGEETGEYGKRGNKWIGVCRTKFWYDSYKDGVPETYTTKESDHVRRGVERYRLRKNCQTRISCVERRGRMGQKSSEGNECHCNDKIKEVPGSDNPYWNEEMERNNFTRVFLYSIYLLYPTH